MESWQLFHRYLEIMHHPLKREIVVYLVNPRHLFHSIPLDVCLVCQLKRCFNVSLHELILSCSIFTKIDFSRVFLSFLLSCWMEFSEHDVETKMMIESRFLWNATWIEKIVLVCVLSLHLTLRLNLETRFLFSGGELSQP